MYYAFSSIGPTVCFTCNRDLAFPRGVHTRAFDNVLDSPLIFVVLFFSHTHLAPMQPEDDSPEIKRKSSKVERGREACTECRRHKVCICLSSVNMPS